MLLGLAAVAYAMFWYNFALVADRYRGLQSRLGFTVSVVGLLSTAAPFAKIDALSLLGWVGLGVAMIIVAFAILKARLLPDGFAWLSAILGFVTIIAGITGDTSDIGTGSVYVLLVWVISISALFIGWGSAEDDGMDVLERSSE